MIKSMWGENFSHLQKDSHVQIKNGVISELLIESEVPQTSFGKY